MCDKGHYVVPRKITRRSAIVGTVTSVVGLTGVAFAQEGDSAADTSGPSLVRQWEASVDHDVEGVALTDDGAYAAVKDDDLIKFDRSGDEQWERDLAGPGEDAAVHPDGGVVVVGGSVVYHFDRDGSVEWSEDGGVGQLSSVTAAADGSVYAASADGRLLRVADGDLRWTRNRHSGEDTEGVAVNGAGNVLSAGDDQTAAETSPSGDLVDRFDYGNDDLEDVDVGPDGGIYLSSDDGSVLKLDADWNERWTASLPNAVERLTAGPDGTAWAGGTTRLAAFSSDGRQGWTLDTGTQVDSIAVDDDGLVAGTADRRVLFFDI